MYKAVLLFLGEKLNLRQSFFWLFAVARAVPTPLHTSATKSISSDATWAYALRRRASTEIPLSLPNQSHYHDEAYASLRPFS